jgi:hypothetical protein
VIQQWDEILRMIATIKLKEVRSCETASEFDPQNWWTKWGAILGVAQSPKILSIKGISEMACRVWYLCWNLTIVAHKWKGDARWCSASQGST